MISIQKETYQCFHIICFLMFEGIIRSLLHIVVDTTPSKVRGQYCDILIYPHVTTFLEWVLCVFFYTISQCVNEILPEKTKLYIQIIVNAGKHYKYLGGRITMDRQCSMLEQDLPKTGTFLPTENLRLKISPHQNSSTRIFRSKFQEYPESRYSQTIQKHENVERIKHINIEKAA